MSTPPSSYCVARKRHTGYNHFLRKMLCGQKFDMGTPEPLNEVVGHWTVRWSAFGMRRL